MANQHFFKVVLLVNQIFEPYLWFDHFFILVLLFSFHLISSVKGWMHIGLVLSSVSVVCIPLITRLIFIIITCKKSHSKSC